MGPISPFSLVPAWEYGASLPRKPSAWYPVANSAIEASPSFSSCRQWRLPNVVTRRYCVRRNLMTPLVYCSPGDAEAMTVEARLRLLAGLKRYFHNKRAEGLLSGEVLHI